MVEDKEQRIETLQDRVDELEATVSKMLPSRRDALKLGAAGAVGAVGMAGSASAQNSNQVGTIGTDSDRVDVNAEDIDAVSVNTESVGSNFHYVEGYSGADVDARLDAALTAANDGDVIYLEGGTYSEARTISKSVKIRGPVRSDTAAGGNGAAITGAWELTGRPMTLSEALIQPDTALDVAARDILVSHCWVATGGAGISVTGRDSDNDASGVIVSSCHGAGDLTFVSGSTGALVDSCELAITDNGTNTVGDIAE